MHNSSFSHQPMKDLARFLLRSWYRRLFGPAILFAALAGALAELGLHLELLTQPSLLLKDAHLMRKYILFTALAVAGIKLHLTFTLGEGLLDRLQERGFRCRELMSWSVILSAIALTAVEYPYNLVVFLLLVLPTVMWELRAIARLKSRNKGRADR